MISPRLFMISRFITKCNYICDIGTDHSLLPVFLIKSNKANKVYATDINLKPLSQAKKNIKKYNLENYIEVIQSDGLMWMEKYPKLILDYCVIAGIGAKNTINILINDSPRIQKYIICVNNNQHLIREWIKKKKYYIQDEQLVRDNDIIYNVILVNKYAGIKVKTKDDIMFGPYLRKHQNKLFKDFWILEYARICDFLSKIPKNNLNYRKMVKKVKKINKILKKGNKFNDKNF